VDSSKNNITDLEILKKIIEVQACIIHGHSIKALLHQNRNFYLEKSEADIITIYMHEHGQVHIEYVLEKSRFFVKLLEKYLLMKKNFKWDKFMQNCDTFFNKNVELKYHTITDFFELFKGFLSKKYSDAFTLESGLKYGHIMPLLDYNGKDKIGYVCFIFQSDDVVADMEKLDAVKTSLELLLQPLYDKTHDTIYTKCIRIDEQMRYLTEKERAIVQRVFAGESYTSIAETLGISINTIKTHMKNIFNKHNVSSKIELYNKFHIRFK